MRRAAFLVALFVASVAAANVTVSKNGPTSARAGDTVTYFVSVTNAGATTALNVRLADAQPNSASYVSAEQTSGPPFDCIVGDTETIVCTVEAFDPGASASFSFVYRIDGGAPAGTQIVNRADVDAGAPEDPDFSHSSATATTSVVTGTPDPLPQINFSASDAVVPVGGGVTLTWSVTNATSVSIDHGLGTQPASGSVVVIVYATTTYTLTATGPGGTATARATVAIASAPMITFTATPPTVSPGQTSRLEWSVSDADEVTIDNGLGAQASSGVKDVQPAVTTTYALTARGPGGVSTARVTVTVAGTIRRRAALH